MAAIRRATKQGMGAVRTRSRTSIVPGPIICPPPTPQAESSEPPPRMRSGAVAKAIEPSEPPPASGKKQRRLSRQPPSVRIDDVGATAASMSGALAIPRPTLAARRPTAKLDTREAWVLSLVDGTLAIDDIADVTGIPRAEVVAIVTRLADVGYVVKGRFR